MLIKKYEKLIFNKFIYIIIIIIKYYYNNIILYIVLVPHTWHFPFNIHLLLTPKI